MIITGIPIVKSISSIEIVLKLSSAKKVTGQNANTKAIKIIWDWRKLSYARLIIIKNKLAKKKNNSENTIKKIGRDVCTGEVKLKSKISKTPKMITNNSFLFILLINYNLKWNNRP